MKYDNIREKILKIFDLLFILFFIVILINTIFFNQTIKIDFPIWGMIISMIILYLVLFIIYKLYPQKKNKTRNWPKILVIAIIIISLQLIFASLTYTHQNWDCGIVTDNAWYLYQGQEINTEYFARYPNNIALLLLFKYIFVIVRIIQNNNITISSILNSCV